MKYSIGCCVDQQSDEMYWYQLVANINCVNTWYLGWTSEQLVANINCLNTWYSGWTSEQLVANINCVNTWYSAGHANYMLPIYLLSRTKNWFFLQYHALLRTSTLYRIIISLGASMVFIWSKSAKWHNNFIFKDIFYKMVLYRHNRKWFTYILKFMLYGKYSLNIILNDVFHKIYNNSVSMLDWTTILYIEFVRNNRLSIPGQSLSDNLPIWWRTRQFLMRNASSTSVRDAPITWCLLMTRSHLFQHPLVVECPPSIPFHSVSL